MLRIEMVIQEIIGCLTLELGLKVLIDPIMDVIEEEKDTARPQNIFAANF